MAETLSKFTITTRRKQVKETNGFADHDMVFEILTLLPAKSLMRFRCVSKTWNGWIRCDSNFVKLHNARSQARPQATRLLYEMVKMYPVEKTLNYSTQLEELTLQLVRPLHYFGCVADIVCSNHCNGLVCCANYESTQIYLYNVTTREMKVLPFLNGVSIRSPPILLLGFDPNTKKYKLLLLHLGRSKKTKIGYYKMKILTLGTNSWRSLDEKYNRPQSYSNECVFLNGILYWKSYDVIITFFNFIEEKFGTITISNPQIRSRSSNLNRILTVVLGKLVIKSTVARSNEELNWVYDEVNNVFTKFNSNSKNKNEEKVVLIEAENIHETSESYPNRILATSSLISASTSLLIPYPFCIRRVSRFVENIIPLIFYEE